MNSRLKDRIKASCRHVRTGDSLRYEVPVEIPNAAPITLFYEISGERLPPPLSRLDFIALALVFLAMRNKHPLHIEGPVSKRLLTNLVEFQRAWSSWVPQTYAPVEISCAELVEEAASRRSVAVAAFSGGVDATFGLLYHTSGLARLDRVGIGTAMLIHGFDIDLDSVVAFEHARRNAETTTHQLGVPLTTVRTNFKTAVSCNWEHDFAAGLAACLHLFSESFDTGLMGSDEDYEHFVLPWGSNPVTNPFLSSAGMIVVSEGAGFTRTDKVAVIGRQPSVCENLRVCWEGPQTGRNCGICEKCIRTKMNFLAAGHEIPRCLGDPPTPGQVRRLKARNRTQLSYLVDIRKHAERNNLDTALMGALRWNIWFANARLAASVLRRRTWKLANALGRLLPRRSR